MGRGGWESRAVTAAVVLVLALAGLVVVAVRNADEADRRTLAASSVDVTTSTTVAGTTPTSMGVPASTTTTSGPGDGEPSAGVAGALDAEDGLSITGIGPITVGMTVAEAEEAAGVAFGPVPGADAEPEGAACRHLAVPGDEPLVLAMVVDGVVSRIDVTDGSPVETLSGVGIGATAQAVRDTYGERIVEEPNPSDGTGTQLRYVADQPTHSLIFEIGDGVVTAFRSGFTEQLGDPEGCS